MPQFAKAMIDTGEAHIFATYGGSGPPLALLHGFPETHLMWREVAPILARSSFVVAIDLRGYGQSSCPRSDTTHAAYSKRSLSRDVLAVMEHLGHQQFAVVGHDRGGRVAYRLALDHPERVSALAVLDILVGSEAWDRADARLALSFWPWSFLAQPAPLPERVLENAAPVIIADAATQWDSPPEVFSADVRAAYAAVLAESDHAHAICEEYRAAATVDRDHDIADHRAGRKIRCPTLVLWAANSALDTWYVNEGGPLQIWRQWADDVRGVVVVGGHFFPVVHPKDTARRLQLFFGGVLRGS
jgi:haloacetate dehalogenase